MIRQLRTWAMIGLAITCLADSAMAQRGGRGGGGRGGGGRGGGGFRGGGGGGGFRGGGGGGGGMRAAARPSVSRPAGGFGGGGGFGGNVANRPGAGNIGNRPGNVVNNPNRGNIVANNPNRGNINNIGNRTNINNRPVNVGDVDVNGGSWGDWDDHWDGCCYNPWGAAAAGAIVGSAITAASVGTTVYALPSDCVTTVVNGIAYNHCGDTWYQPQFEGTTTSYVVVSPP